ncbi:MAG: hypothetical protein U9Q37_03670 [Euryarchaeota archaeon]|nr:hypothetical protein [Euryarchaeota archaeon]
MKKATAPPTTRIHDEMIFPAEYKCVGAIRTDEMLSDANNELLRRKTCQTAESEIYFLSEYLLIFAADGCAVYSVTSEGEGLFRTVTSLARIASGDEVVQYGKLVNMHNRTELVKTAHRCCTDAVNTVIFKSVDQHLTFVHRPDPGDLLEIDVLDVIPPVPGWLTYMVGRLNECLLGELGVVFTENVLDLRQFESEDAVFPCFTSGLSGRYLDSEEITAPATLIGCDISKMILEARFPGLDYKFTNICSRTSDLYRITKPFIARCCQSEHSGLIEIEGIDGVVVHWAASGYEVADALRDLVQKIRSRP